MGRHTRFDRNTVLDHTLSLFWSRGFAASSVRQLEEVTDLHPGSIYHQFQNKEGLYLAVLQRYIEHQLTRRIEKHLSSGQTLEGLRRFFTSGYRHPKNEQYRNCCFLACSSTELHLLPDEARTLVHNGLAQIQQAMEQWLQKAVEKSILPADFDCADRAREMTSFFLGLQLLARIKPNQHQLDSQVKSSLQHILQLSR